MARDLYDECDGDRWIGWIELFLPLVSNSDGYFVHLPFAGGYFEQPGTTMRILRAIQDAYYAYLKEQRTF